MFKTQPQNIFYHVNDQPSLLVWRISANKSSLKMSWQQIISVFWALNYFEWEDLFEQIFDMLWQRIYSPLINQHHITEQHFQQLNNDSEQRSSYCPCYCHSHCHFHQQCRCHRLIFQNYSHFFQWNATSHTLCYSYLHTKLVLEIPRICVLCAHLRLHDYFNYSPSTFY